MPRTLRRRILAVLAVAAVVVGAVALVSGGAGDDRRDRRDRPAATAPAAPSSSPTAGLAQLRPQPADAKADRPAFYDDGSGCQVKDGDPVPVVCSSGDESAERTMMLVGDSKIAQWETAYSDLGRAHGWRIKTVTKSACPFTDAVVTVDKVVKTDCRRWGRAALREILAAKPQIVVTSQRADTALLEQGDDRTRGEMIRGLRSYWQQLLDAGIEVVVHLDNPFPTTHPVYECVEQNPHAMSECDFRADEGLTASAAPVLAEAAEGLPGVRVLDMTPAICRDDGWCPAVVGDVLVYRSGSHLTRTFTVSVEPQLEAALARATGGAFTATAP